MKKIHYRVQSGDSLPSIARRHNIPEDVLSRMNGVSGLGVNSIKPGQVLQIPQEGQSTQRALTQPQTDRICATDKTLADIAQRNNVTVEALAQANGISDPDQELVFGLKLKIPPVSGSGTAKDNQATKGAEGKLAPIQQKAGAQQASSPEEVKGGGTPSEETVPYWIEIPRGTSSKEEFLRYAETFVFGRIVNFPWTTTGPGLAKILDNIANHVGTKVRFSINVSDLAQYGKAGDAAVKAEKRAGDKSYAALSSAERARINEEIDRRYYASEGSPFGKKIKPNEIGKIAIWNSFKQQVMAEKRKLDALNSSPDDAIVLATSTLELASRALERGQGELAANILQDGAAELESPATAVSSSKKPILDAILSTMKARAAGYLQTAPRPQAEKAFELITLSKKVKAVGKGIEGNSEHAKLLEELATDSLVQAEFLLHAADNTEVMIGRGISQTYRAIVNACFDKRIGESGTLNNLFTKSRDNLKADKTKINEAFDYVDRKMEKAGLSFDRAWSAMFNEHHLVEKKDLPSFPTEHEAAVFLRDHEVTRGLLMPMSDLARSLCEGKMQGADSAAAESIKALRKNDQWEVARALLDELSKSARTPEGADLAQQLNDSERREWWSQKAQQFIVDDLPVLVLSTLISGGIGIGARTLALTAKWGPKAARGMQLTAELLSFVPTERVLNDVINNRRADWSAYGMARDYLMTVASFGLFYTLGVCWRAWRIPPKVVPDAAKTAATPKGRPKEIPANEKAKENINALNRENESAVILRENNYPIEQQPAIPGGRRPGVKDPDYRIGRVLFDNHAPNTKNARSIWSTAEGKVKSEQARRLVINLGDSKVDLAALQKQFAEWPIDGLEQVLVITRDKKILSLRLAKPFTNFTPKGYPDQRD